MLRLLIPLAMVASAVVGWLGFRKGNAADDQQWRDSSLDNWRRERAERAERERAERFNGPDSDEGEGEGES